MRLLFNKNDKGTTELKELTGSFYENNDFDRIKTDLLLETEKIVDLVGSDVYTLAEVHYHDAPEGGINYDDLVHHLQLPISLMGTYRYYQSNIMSHEDSGRKLKVDRDTEATPWEWMLDRDDEAQLRKAYFAIDRLIRFLDKSGLEQWTGSQKQKATKTLFINNTQAFHDRYPIEESPRFFYAVLPFISEVQRKVIQKAIGKTKYEDLLSKFQGNNNLSDQDQDLLDLIQDAIPMITMAVAVKRLSVRVLPEGVVQQFRSMLQGRQASQTAAQSVINEFSSHIEKEGQKALDEIKKFVALQEPVNYQLLPTNSENNKYCRT